MGNEKTTKSAKTSTKPVQRIMVEDKSANKPTAKTSRALIKPKSRVPARIIREAEVIEDDTKIKKSASPKATHAKNRPLTKVNPSKSTTKTAAHQKTNQKNAKTKFNMKLPTFRKIHLKLTHIIAIALVLILAIFFGRVAIWEHNYLIAMEGSERNTADTTEDGIYEGGEDVDTTEPTETQIAEYHVAADKPRYLTIRSIGIYNARVVEVGLKSSGEMGTPVNVYDVGWYTGSALPGQAGTSVINAHGGDLGIGIFRYLPRINIGDQIIIEMGDETTKYIYNVVDIVYKNIGNDANDYMPTAFASPKPGVPSLTLITCTGDWLQTQNTYSQRLFVRAILQE